MEFESKGISRQHCEVWTARAGGPWFIRDAGSSSGTFFNGARLSGKSVMSKPYSILGKDLTDEGISFRYEDASQISLY